MLAASVGVRCCVAVLQVKARVEAYKALPAAEREKTDPMKFVFDGIRLVVSLCCLDCVWVWIAL